VEELHAALLASARTSEKVEALEKSLEVSRQENAALRRRLGAPASAPRPAAEKDDRTAEPDGDPTQDGASGGAATLELFLDGKLRTVVDLAGGPSQILVGRAPDCELHLDSRFVSRHHALISRAGDRVVIEDLNSANGVFVDSRRVSRSDLHPGNTVAIGNFRLRVKRVQPNQAFAESPIPASSVAREPGLNGAG
jgi:pSer/pThr/pTyr-binding forkhead associated (FHA) protein